MEFSFEDYDSGNGPGDRSNPVNATTNYNSTFPVANKVAPFTSVDGTGRIWDERFVNGKNWTPYDPSNPDEAIFMELLQSATISGTADPANTQAYWNETSYGIPDFDRIMAQEYVYPNTTYNLTFYHMDGGISSATFADGGSTLVQIQGMDSDYAVSQLTEAPSDWAQQTFQFTTGPTTNKIAILFSAYADGSDVAILLDKIGLTPQISINCDVDSDGVGNGIDLDSDNDGIYDVVEAGNADLDTNGDGMIDENDAGFVDANANGAHDTIEGRTPTDTDSDTTVDMFDLDSDNDGCNDVIEGGYSDPNLDGLLGDNPVLVDQNGKVTSGIDGYTTPIDQNNNNLQDYVDADWDVNCVNPGLSIIKSANPIDLDGDGLIQLNDQIVYTIIVSNTSEVNVTYTLSDTLVNENGLTISNPELVWTDTSTGVSVSPPYNYVLKSSNFSYNGNNNTWDSNYWHIDHAYYNSTGYYDHRGYSRPWIPTLDDTYIYYAGNSTGATPAQTGLTVGYTDSSGGNEYGYKVVSASNYFNHQINFYNQQSYSSTGSYGKSWKYVEIENLEPNTDYTLSVFAMPRESGAMGSQNFEWSDGFYLLFHSAPANSSWSTNYSTNWSNVQKSARFYPNEYKYTRYSHTFTTGNSVGTTRVGIQYPHWNGYGINFYGLQLEKGSEMSPIYTYTYSSSPDVTNAPPILPETDPRETFIAPGVAATYMVTITLDQSIIDSAQELYNQVTANVQFVTPLD